VLTTAVVLFGTAATILKGPMPALGTIFETVVRWATPAY
jgi:hypothetical protein